MILLPLLPPPTAIPNNYTVTISAGSLDCSFTELNVSITEVGSLDISGAPALRELSCRYNQLTELDVSANTALTYLYCYNNQLPLSDLYAASEKIKNTDSKMLGTQTWVSQDMLTGVAIDLSAQAEFGGTPTVFRVRKGGVAALENTDYTLAGGKLRFLTAGSYTVEMTNTAITSHADFPAKVVASYEVSLPEQIFFTWKGLASGTKSITIRATSDKPFTVDWGNGTTTTHSGAGGATDVPLTSPAYGNTESYTVSIMGGSLDCNFTELSCSSNRLTTLDISKNTALQTLYCDNNQLTTLDISKNTALTRLDCYYNRLTALDISNNTALIRLDCFKNQLSELNVSKNTVLTELFCNLNRLTTLDVSANTKLKYLDCSDNQLTALDVSANTKLEHLYCYNNRLSLSDLYAASLKISNADYKWLGTQTWELQNVLTGVAIDLSAQAEFGGTPTVFTVQKGGVAALENTDYTLADGKLVFLSAGSYTVEMTNAAITSNYYYPAKVVASYEVSLPERISFTWKGLASGAKSIQVRATARKSFTVDWGNGTTETKTGAGINTPISLTSPAYGNTGDYTVTITAGADCRFTYLDVMNSEISRLDLSRAPSLTDLYCHYNQLTSLDISKNTALTYLQCNNNPLQTLDVSKNTALSFLKCYYNQLQTLDVSANTALTTLSCSDNPLQTLDVKANTKLATLWCNKNQLTNLDVSKNTALTKLSCDNNQLQTLDINKNTALTNLSCNNTQLQTLDLSKNTALTGLSCSNNQLQTLDISANTALTALQCNKNQLTSLDVSANTGLINLDCSNNQLTSLDVSANTKLTYLYCYGNRLSLHDLYAASQKISDVNNKFLGTQIWETRNAVTGSEIDLSAQAEFGATPTVFTVKKGGAPAFEDSDYSLVEGKLLFHNTGSYKVEMTNAAITSHSNTPAKVVAAYEVGIATELDVASGMELSVYPNPVRDILYISTTSMQLPQVKLYSINGRLLYTNHSDRVDMSTYVPGLYIVEVNGEKVKVVKK